MKGGTAAYRYAKALFGLAQDEHRHREVRAELEKLGSLFEQSRELRDALLTPLHPAAERKNAVRAIASGDSISPLVHNFLSYLIDQRRLIDFSDIVDAFGDFADEAEGLITAEVVAATVTPSTSTTTVLPSAAVPSKARMFGGSKAMLSEMQVAGMLLPSAEGGSVSPTNHFTLLQNCGVA